MQLKRVIDEDVVMKKRKRMIIKRIAVLILLTGVSLVAYTAYEYKSGEKESEQLI